MNKTKENFDYLVDDEHLTIDEHYTAHVNKQVAMELAPEPYMIGQHCYTLRCPCCGRREQIWPRGATDNTLSKNADLGSNGDNISFHLQCEECCTEFDLVLFKQSGFCMKVVVRKYSYPR